MQVLWTGQGLGNGRLKLDVPARALKFYLPHALGEGRRQFTVLQDCALVAPGRLARYRLDEGVPGSKAFVRFQNAPSFPEVGLGGPVAGIEETGQLSKVTVFFAVKLLIYRSSCLTKARVLQRRSHV